jgi:hypothetical protein
MARLRYLHGLCWFVEPATIVVGVVAPLTEMGRGRAVFQTALLVEVRGAGVSLIGGLGGRKEGEGQRRERERVGDLHVRYYCEGGDRLHDQCQTADYSHHLLPDGASSEGSDVVMFGDQLGDETHAPTPFAEHGWNDLRHILFQIGLCLLGVGRPLGVPLINVSGGRVPIDRRRGFGQSAPQELRESVLQELREPADQDEECERDRGRERQRERGREERQRERERREGDRGRERQRREEAILTME